MTTASASAPAMCMSMSMSMSDALTSPSPADTLKILINASKEELKKSKQSLHTYTTEKRPPTKQLTNTYNTYTQHISKASHVNTNLHALLNNLKDSGSQASKEVLELEQKSQTLEIEITDLTNCLELRQQTLVACEAFYNKSDYATASNAIKVYREVRGKTSESALTMADCDARFREVEDALVKRVLQQYEDACTVSAKAKPAGEAQAKYNYNYNLEGLSDLTPLLGTLQLADQGVGLYLRYSKAAVVEAMSMSLQDEININIIAQLAKIFNGSVTHLRHHLPMVAHALGGADGDVGLVQIVNVEVEKRAVALLREFCSDKDLANLCARGEDVSTQIEDRFIAGDDYAGSFALFEHQSYHVGEDALALGGTRVLPTEGAKNKNVEHDDDARLLDDCGFSSELGEVAELDALLDELALVLQYTEAYERFIRHAAEEVSRARAHRLELKKQDKHEKKTNTDEEVEVEVEIIARYTELNKIVAEIGGSYSGLERTLMMGNMQRAFINGTSSDSRNYTELASQSISASSVHGNVVGSKALQTSLVEETFYAAQRSTLRAFATGHTGTACAAANFCADAIGRVLLEVLSKRVEECASALKPGKGLLVGQGGLGKQAFAALSTVGIKATKGGENPEQTRRQIEDGIARACAAFNDMEIAVAYTRQLETQFQNEVDNGFPAGDLTEQLEMCIKSLGSIADELDAASKQSIYVLSQQILPRVRAIVNDAVGQENTGAAAMGGVTVGVMSTSNVASSVRMNYDLDDEAYELSQAGDGYLARMCSALDDLLNPIRAHLSPKLSDDVMIAAIGGAAKRIEAAIRKCRFTALGSLSLDADVRQFIAYTKQRLASPEYSSTSGLYAVCLPIARLSQISMLMNVADLDDVADIMRRAKGNWDLHAEDSKTFLNLRVDFESKKVNELLRLDDDDL